MIRALALIAFASLAGTAAAAPVDIFFTRINPANASQNIASQLKAVLSDEGAGQVSFLYTNNVGIASSISEIYYDTGNLFTGAASLVQVGTNFTAGGANPTNLPGGNNVNPAFVANLIYSADAQGNPSNGVNLASDSLKMVFNLSNNVSYANVVAALANGSLRIGLHVRAIGTGADSDAFVNTGTPVIIPLPAGGVMAMAGLAGVAAIRRRRA